ncbi:hypothetical protein SAMN04515618_108119 [Collimonas sp. OK307]|uniref:hypothetical protein n=1 Tax=Collimonas sp. OK307 TaxID=1801620 RepID=UPI0008F14A17|nr:hypothetical protein [Collimonas sp. OK307]SFI03323.1 hypothetical protein SAMN04515618_108119 [Collimonas sp. OK307]
MTFLEMYSKEIISVLSPFGTFLLNRWFKAKAKLQVAPAHQFAFLVQEPLLDNQGRQVQPNQVIYTRSFLIRNAGRETATKLEVVFNWKPMYLNIWPIRKHTQGAEPDNRHVLVFDSLSPGELVRVEVLSLNHNLPALLTVRSAECIAKNIDVNILPVVKKPLLILIWTLIGTGFATCVYLALLLMQRFFSRRLG